MIPKVLCFGGRDYSDRDKVFFALSHLLSIFSNPSFAVIQGGARGADLLSKQWAILHGHPMIEVPAPWDFYGKRAGHIRNQWMLEICKPTYAVGFPGGRGTADMASRLTKEGVPLWLPYDLTPPSNQ